MKRHYLFVISTALLYAAAANDYDQGWLRYAPLPLEDSELEQYRNRFRSLCVPSSIDTPILSSAKEEWFRGLQGLLGAVPQDVTYKDACRRRGNDGIILELTKDKFMGYRMRTSQACDKDNIKCAQKTIIRASDDRGLLSGVFGLLRRLQTNPQNLTLHLYDMPRTELRVWNVWDNLDGTVQDGDDSSSSLFEWNDLPDVVSPRYQDYARLLASVGTNGIAFMNQNACQHENGGLLESSMLPKLAMVAEIFGNWGIDLFLSPCFASPMTVGGFETADPQDDKVKSWWSDTVGTISHRIPTFGGFLMTGDATIDPSLVSYGVNQSVSANMLARVIKPVNGTLLWRPSFQSSSSTNDDTAVQPYETLMPYDGEFDDNVVLQLKSGPLEQQVREPVSPLFWGLRQTRVMLELQVSQPSQGKALVALAPQWEYYLSTLSLTQNTKLRDVIHAGVSGVGNFDNSASWAGVVSMPNAYAWGRLAWDPNLSAEQILDEWILMTFGWDDSVRFELLDVLMFSWEVFENYTCPLGMGVCFDQQDHVTPAAYDNNDLYIHADETGIGFDRTDATGSGFIGQYENSIAQMFEDVEQCPEELLLSMHHVDWQHPLRSHGNVPLIEYLYESHASGVRSVDGFMRRWALLDPPLVDENRHNQVAELLSGQVQDAKDFCVAMVDFFEEKSGISPKKPSKTLCDPAAEVEEEEIIIEREERKAAGIGGGLGFVLTVAGMIFTAYQMQEYPDGIYASICRVAVVIGSYIVSILFIPCRAFCGKRYHRNGHMPIGQVDYQEPYNDQNGQYS